jgi:hypothetical protein
MTNFSVHRANHESATPLLVHVPHSSTAVPKSYRSQIILPMPARKRETMGLTLARPLGAVLRSAPCTT